MNKAYMLIGPPASGKSTFTEAMKARQPDVVVINPDSIREQMTGDAADQSMNSQVWARVYDEVAFNLAYNNDVVIDATFANAKQRQEMVHWCVKNGAEEVHGIVFQVDPEELKRRNQGRDRKVPEHVIDRMVKSLQLDPPSKREWFTSLTYIQG